MLEIGQLVDNKYRVLDVVGKGGMSVVYLARNERANKSWAIKEVRKVGEENLEVKRNSLIAETEMLKNLSHPNLPTIVDVIETDDTFLVVMDYIEGNDLGEILKEFGAQPQEKVIEWGLQLCDVLGYLHTREKPIIYRDLKPANIMLKPDGNIMLIDFGTAREIKIADANDTISLGTRGYAAPEQFGANAKTDARTDIYCLGATMYHLVTNHNPATEPYVMSPIRERNPALSAGLEKIILKCTQNNPDERYQSCAELMYALEHYDTIDEAYRKKQKGKLSSFIAMIVMMFVCLGVALFANISAQNKKAEDIDTYLIEAANEDNTRKDREKAYRNAILLDPSDERFYNGLLDLYLTTDEKGNNETGQQVFSTIEANELSRLDLKNENKIVPLEEFKKKNKTQYEKFCKDVGMSCWYKMPDNVSTRKSVAAEWFDRYLDSVDDKDSEEAKFIQIYYSINECEKNATKQGRASEKKENSNNLWGLMEDLYSLCQNSNDDEAVILACSEIIKEIQKHGLEFSKMGTVTENDVLKIVEDVESMIGKVDKNDSDLMKIVNENFTTVGPNGEAMQGAEFFKQIKDMIHDNFR